MGAPRKSPPCHQCDSFVPCPSAGARLSCNAYPALNGRRLTVNSPESFRALYGGFGQTANRLLRFCWFWLLFFLLRSNRRRRIDQPAVVNDLADLAPIQGLVLEQGLGDCYQYVLTLGQNFHRALIRIVAQALDLAVDLLRSRFA